MTYRNDENYTIDWLIAMKARHYICRARESDLYLCENLLVARASVYRTNKTNTSKQLLVSQLHIHQAYNI